MLELRFALGGDGLPAVEVDGACDDGVGYFGEDGAGDECDPGVDLGAGFAGFIQATEMKVSWLQLLD